MKKAGLVLTAILTLGALLLPLNVSFAATDGIYQLSEVPAAWDGTDASRLKDPSADYDYGYGDEGSISYTLPWPVGFYGASYSQIVIDSNGHIRLGSSSASANSFNLSVTGIGPVIAPWNNDLSSYYYGGFFAQHKTNPERVVIEWQAETYTEEGLSRPNDFEVVIFPDGTIRFDYKSFASQAGKDFGSGISKGDGSASISLTSNYGNAFSLAGRSFIFASGQKLSVAAPVESFGDQCYGATSQPHTVIVTNSGTGNLVIDSVKLSGGDSAMFSIVAGGDGCTGATLSPGQGCTVKTVFSPTAIGPLNAILTISSSNPVPLVQNVALNGIGRYPTLTVTKSDLGTGTVTSSPGGISCGATCVGQYMPADIVTLTAAPDAGSVFTGWSGACSGTGTCMLAMNDFKSVSASFSQTVPPTVAIASPQGIVNNSRPVLQYTANSGTVAVKVDGVVVNKASGDMLDTLSEGSHVVRVEAANKAGYTSFAESAVIVDTIPPAVASVTPAEGSSNVPLETSVSVRFAEALDPSSVTADMLSLGSQGGSVAGSVTLSSDRTTLTFKPDNIFASSSTYTFTLKAGAWDVAGNTVTGDLAVTFTTTSKVSLLIENQGTASSPHHLAPGSYTALTIRNSYVVLDGAVDADTVNITSNSTLTQKATGLTGMELFDLTVAGELYIDATSKIDVSGKGYLGAWQGGNNSDRGRTLGNVSGSTSSTGGGYGGLGGFSAWGGSPNGTYGNMLLPNELGSGGGGNGSPHPGGNGGGMVRLAAGSLTLNGSILADGMTVTGGGGSGGGVYIGRGCAVAGYLAD